MKDEDVHSEAGLLLERERKARAILGVDASAAVDEIRRAFRQLSLACHPDTNPSDTDAARRFRLVRCAYTFLVSGDTCPELEQARPSTNAESEARQRLDNDWAYWCWWRDKFFGQDL